MHAHTCCHTCCQPHILPCVILLQAVMCVRVCVYVQSVGERWVQELRGQEAGVQSFQMGFHSIPSMRQLHLHLISQVPSKLCCANVLACVPTRVWK